MHLGIEIDEILTSNKKKFVGRHTYSTITRRLGSIFNFPKDLKFKYECYNDIEPETFTVSGLFDMCYNKKYVILNVSKKDCSLYLDDCGFESFKFYLSQTIQHETIHQMQWSHRDEIDEAVKLDFRNMTGSINEERDYLSDIDEIEAYAHDIAMEIKYFYPDSDPLEILKTINKRRKVPSYSYYRKTFRNCDWSCIKNRLLNKTYKWMPYA